MKEGFDREIDLLLRRRARGTAESRSWGDGAQGAHLDADELGAFAEGALPAGARLAAVSHLADCESCRGVVVGLARVVGAGAGVKPQAVAATVPAVSERTPAWRALLASLFAPRVMRFAVPVLALSLVGVVSYVALRSNNGGALQTTKDTRPQQGTLQNEASAPAVAANHNGASNVEQLDAPNSNAEMRRDAATGAQPNESKGHGSAEAPRPAEAEAVRTDTEEAAPVSPPPPPATAAPTEGPAELSKSAPRPVTTEDGETARSDSKEKQETRDKSARQSEPSDDLAANDAALRNRAAQSRMNQVQMPDGSTRNEKRAADNNASGNYSGGGNAAASPPKESERERAGSRSEAAGRARAPKRAEKKADEADEDRPADTRAVAGHRFRREGNAWVDVNYKSSMPSTGVRRGTDAFRALVADVPEVGRVAAAIGGEVTVVVGGHAYRIR